MPPVEEWLKARLSSGPAPSEAVVAEARSAGFSIGDLMIGKRSLSLESVRGAFGKVMWALPGSAPAVTRPVAAVTTVKKPKRRPEDYTQKASDMARRAAPRAIRAMSRMLDPVRDDGPPCPSCGRGMPRPEDLILKAATAVADRGGVGPAKGVGDMTDTGPMIVLPPGTRLAVAVEVPGGAGAARLVGAGRSAGAADGEPAGAVLEQGPEATQ